MIKRITRFVALLLVPALLMDPAFCSPPALRLSVTKYPAVAFNEQAMTLPGMSDLDPPSGQARKVVTRSYRSAAGRLQPRVTPRANDSETETLLEQLARRVFELNRALVTANTLGQSSPADLTEQLQEIGKLLELPELPKDRAPSGEWSREVAAEIDQHSARFKPLDAQLRQTQGDDDRRALNADMSTLNGEVRQLLDLRMSIQMALVHQQLNLRNRPAACAALMGLYSSILRKDLELFQERVRDYRSQRIAEFQSPHWVATILEMLNLETWDVKVGSGGQIIIPQNRYVTRTITRVIDGKEVKMKVHGSRLMDITYEALEDALRSQAHTIENYGPDFLDVIYHIGELGYARRLLRRNASASARRRATAHLEGVYHWAARGHVPAKTRTTEELKRAIEVLDSIDTSEPTEGGKTTDAEVFALRLAFVHERVNASAEALKTWRLPDIQYIRARVELRLATLLAEHDVSAPDQGAPAPITNSRGDYILDYTAGLPLNNKLVTTHKFAYRDPDNGQKHEMYFPEFIIRTGRFDTWLLPQEARGEASRVHALSNEVFEREALWFLNEVRFKGPRTLQGFLDYLSDRDGGSLSSQIRRAYGTEITARIAFERARGQADETLRQRHFQAALNRIVLLNEILFRWSRPAPQATPHSGATLPTGKTSAEELKHAAHRAIIPIAQETFSDAASRRFFQILSDITYGRIPGSVGASIGIASGHFVLGAGPTGAPITTETSGIKPPAEVVGVLQSFAIDVLPIAEDAVKFHPDDVLAVIRHMPGILMKIEQVARQQLGSEIWMHWVWGQIVVAAHKTADHFSVSIHQDWSYRPHSGSIDLSRAA